MNPHLLTSEVQHYLEEKAGQSPAKVALKKSPFEKVSAAELAEQVDTRQRLKSKLPHWIEAKKTYFPPRQNAEQCSSEATALYKAHLVGGKQAIDLTGGFGVDVWAFSQRFDHVDYCEMNAQLFPLVKHNFEALRCDNVDCHLGDALITLAGQKRAYDLIYLDPARRDEHNRKMVSFSDCVPNVVEHKTELFKHSENILIKASPMMDITLAINELVNVTEVHVVALKNECKEVLFFLKKGFVGDAEIQCINLKGEEQESFTFNRTQESDADVSYALPEKYLYEPNSAVLKSGAFNSLSEKFSVEKLHSSTHLYTSNSRIENFPGKTYHISHSSDYNKKNISRLIPDKKANAKTYNFAHSPQQMQKKLGLKDGGNIYLFGVKTMDDKYRILIGEKV